MREPTPWPAWLRCALALGLAPHAFWRLSLREWRALAGVTHAMTRTDFAALSARFPDAPNDQ